MPKINEWHFAKAEGLPTQGLSDIGRKPGAGDLPLKDD
ncbi:hypothetical protein BSU04_25235 [Caballeronia sordidicola]|uniref:Uncharacterized protein n=1 Tax=Caballeronia sordidicola TaxID=196367 RepID=A0A226WX28_CABSO|nr:hypothetical protein BSU04_25235 [Caballeronia sordidicola]